MPQITTAQCKVLVHDGWRLNKNRKKGEASEQKSAHLQKSMQRVYMYIF